jgi:fatty acid desaturase
MLPKREWQKLLVVNLLSRSLVGVFSYYVVLWVVSYSLVVQIFDCHNVKDIKHLTYMLVVICLACIEFTWNFSFISKLNWILGYFSYFSEVLL